VNVLLAAFLVAHGLVHTFYFTPPPPRTADGPEWPFEMQRSWLVTSAGFDPAIARVAGTALIIVTIALLVLAALATVGWVVPTAWWPVAALAGAVASAAVLLVFFHPWIVLGLVIDLAIAWAVLVAGWRPLGFGT
jgi:hypothetical protein